MTTTATPRLTPIQVEVIGSALASICEEMGEALIKSSYSPNIKERRDCTTAIFDREGNMLAQAEHIPIHLGSLMGVVSALTDAYALDDIRDGDSFVANDPFTGGGTHLPDIVLVTPLFVGGVLHGWATNLAHHADYAERGHENIFQEGLRIPVVRFLRDWQYLPDVMRMILANMQIPAERIADFNAQVAANRLAVARFTEISENYGVETVAEAGRELLDYTERKTRSGISEIPDGTYRFSDIFECNEIAGDLPLSVEIRILGDHMHLEFDAPPQVRAGINMVKTALLATVYYAVKTIVGPDIPANAGLYRPISVEAPLGSLINCVSPAAVHARVQVCQRVVDLIYGALAEVIPAKVSAASNGAVSSMQFSGIDPRTGKFYVHVESIGGGNGAGCDYDGLDGVQAHITNSSNLPVENLEYEYPLTVLKYELIDGSGGAGEHRGGMGIAREIRINHDDGLCEVNLSRVRTRPWGLFGGQPGTPAWGARNGVVDNSLLHRLNAGERIAMYTAGGGGYGDPARREAQMVGLDVRERHISPEDAVIFYGSSVDPRETSEPEG
jgi:N-methylhydantoinase B